MKANNSCKSVIPSGYKQTEVGVIPEDWEVKPVGQAFEICNNLRLPLSQAVREKMTGDFPYYGPTSIQGYINEYRVEGEYALIGEDGDHFLKWRDQPMTLLVRGLFNVNNHAHLVRGTKNLTAWFYYYFSHRDITHHLTRQGASRYKLTKKTLLEIPCALPPTKAEQEAIAEALSDTDALIESLEQLITKKRHIKQGAMQELLTGKKRLSGFSGEWSTVCMRNILVQNATYGIVTAGTFVQNGTKMLRGGDIVDGRVSLDLPMVSREKALEYIRTTLVKNDVVISLVGYPGATAKIPDELIGANISRAVGLLRLNGKVSPDYLVCFLNSSDGRRMVMAPSAGSAQQVVNLAALNKLEFTIPEGEEQTAIATILSDMDTEINTLETKLAKTRQLKQGMMHNLLTGRIRLI